MKRLRSIKSFRVHLTMVIVGSLCGIFGQLMTSPSAQAQSCYYTGPCSASQNCTLAACGTDNGQLYCFGCSETGDCVVDWVSTCHGG